MPAEAQIAGPRMRDYTTDRSVAVVQRPNSPRAKCGTATCVDVGGRWFLATAAHNIDYLPDDADIQLLPRGERQHPGIPFLRRSHPRSVLYAADVAWLEVDRLVAGRAGLQAVPLPQLRPDHGVGRAYLIQGYPAEEVEVPSSGRFDPLSLCLSLVSVPPINLESALGLEYPPNSPADVGLELVRPGGFSGGGAWTYTGLSVWPFINVEAEAFTAIITTYLESKKTLDAVSIMSWLSLVALDNPETQTLLTL